MVEATINDRPATDAKDGVMRPRWKALLWAVLPLIFLTPPQVWLGKRFESQLAYEERIRAQRTLESYADAVERSVERITEKLDSLEQFVAAQTEGGKTMDRGKFDTFSSGLHASSKWIRAFQIVSDGVISHVHPLKGNEAVLGYNLLTAPPAFRGADINRTLQTGRITITGPLALVQGGLGIVIRKPVRNAQGTPTRLVGIVLNIVPLLAEAGVTKQAIHDVQFAVRGDSGDVFFGAPAVFGQQPVLRRIALPDGAWEMGALPAGGWPAASSTPVLLFHLAGGTIVLLLSLLVYLLASSRESLVQTVRRRTAALRENEQKYRELVEYANSIILRWNADGHIVFLNEFGQRFFGYSAAEIVGRHVLDTIVPPAESGGRDLRRLMDEICADPEAFQQNVNQNMRRNGERVWVAWTNRIVLDARGQLAEILSVGTDITEQRNAEEEVRRLHEDLQRHATALEQRVAERTAQLAQTTQYLDAIIDNMPNPVFYKDGELRYVGCNRAYEQAFGIKRADIIGKTVLDLEYLSVADRHRYQDEQLRLLATGGTLSREATMPYADGKSHQTLYSASAFRRLDGSPGGVVVVFVDITAMKETELALAAAKQAAEAADRIKSAFLATMSHELRTPLNSIIGFTGIVLQGLAGPLNDEQTKQLGMVRDSARHLLALINDVLDISKIEAGELRVAAEPFNLAESIRKVAAIVAPLAEKKSLALRIELPDDIGTMVGDSRRVEQILLNLLGNAIKFTATGMISLAAERIADYAPATGAAPRAAVRLRVSDTGIGIKAEDMDVLFKPFRQVDSALSRCHDGTGLGLAICRRLVTLMGGMIEANSRWQEGSVFIVTLPLDRETAGEAS